MNNEKTDLARLQNVSKMLNKQPKKDSVKANPYANNSKYIPISFVEMSLDESFFGLWQTRNFTSQVVVNEIIGEIELGVFHPVAKEWIWRTGVASTPIQVSAGQQLTPENKIKNTLVKDYPHMKAECIKNAARSLGKLFGRDLNRKFEDQYTPMIIGDDNLPITDGQVGLIDSLIESSILPEEKKKEIEDNINTYHFNDAAKIIDMLYISQKPTLDQQYKEVTS